MTLGAAELQQRRRGPAGQLCAAHPAAMVEGLETRRTMGKAAAMLVANTPPERQAAEQAGKTQAARVPRVMADTQALKAAPLVRRSQVAVTEERA